MTTFSMRTLQKIVREHNRQHDREFRFCFKSYDESCYLWPAKGNTIFYGEIIARFVQEHEVELLIFPDEDRGVRLMIL